MPEQGARARAARRVYTIPAHRGFADALVAGLVPRYAEPALGLARTTLLLPSRRAARTVTEAFIRHAGARGSGLAEGATGLLLPRMAVVGDLDLDETLGPLLDPLDLAEIPPAVDPVDRWLRLARILRGVEGPDGREGQPASPQPAPPQSAMSQSAMPQPAPPQSAMSQSAMPQPALLRRAFEIGRTMDRLLVEGLSPIEVFDRALGVLPEMAEHWRRNTHTFLTVQQHWIAQLQASGETDAPDRRNRLFAHAARRWRTSPPPHPLVVAGVTSASPALADLLRVIADLPLGSVVLPDLDMAMGPDVWDELGRAGASLEPGGEPFGRDDAFTHPQYHLKLLLNRMGVSRDEVRTWHRSGAASSEPRRSTAISNLFLPPRASAAWVGLEAKARRLGGVRLLESPHPEAEAQAIAILIRRAIETPERRVALITPDRALAGRVVAHLRRWDIQADDTAGIPLAQSAAGRLFLLLAEVIAERAAPVPLIALLTHPLAAGGAGRAAWLENARLLDLALRGPRPRPGLEPLRAIAEKRRIAAWWREVEAVLAPLLALEGEHDLAEALDLLVRAAEALCGEAIWDKADGRELGGFVEALRGAATRCPTPVAIEDMAVILRDRMAREAVRPPWGGHPRVAIYGLLEARMSRADLVICGGLVEGKWPGAPSPDAVLPPAVLRALGVPGAEFRIGLAAHDLAAALGAPEVVLSWALRDEGGPVIPSRFVLRVQAMLDDQAEGHRDRETPALAARFRLSPRVAPHPRPRPEPTPQQRRVSVSVTGLDRLRGDPYQFYAGSILKLRKLDLLDAAPSAAWKGEVAHLILQRWHEAGDPEGQLPDIARAVLDEKSAHPLMRSLWWPRLIAAFQTFDGRVRAAKAEGRRVIAVEASGEMLRKGVTIHGRADRIDRLAGGGLAIVDYKTGGPPQRRQVQQGFALQLGVLGLIAEAQGFAGVSGAAERFEYWSLGKLNDSFGYVRQPVRETARQKGLEPEEFLPETARFLDDALDRWILGTEPFTARLNPQLVNYADYDQLMRLDEWIAEMGRAGDDGAQAS